ERAVQRDRAGLADAGLQQERRCPALARDRLEPRDERTRRARAAGPLAHEDLLHLERVRRRPRGGTLQRRAPERVAVAVRDEGRDDALARAGVERVEPARALEAGKQLGVERGRRRLVHLTAQRAGGPRPPGRPLPRARARGRPPRARGPVPAPWARRWAGRARSSARAGRPRSVRTTRWARTRARGTGRSTRAGASPSRGRRAPG